MPTCISGATDRQGVDKTKKARLTSGQISFGVAGLISLGGVRGADEFRWRCWQDEHVEARRWRYEQPDE